MSATRTWSVTLDGSMELRLAVEVNGKVFQAALRQDGYERFSVHAPVPPALIERELRQRLMRTLEDELLGPRP